MQAMMRKLYRLFKRISARSLFDYLLILACIVVAAATIIQGVALHVNTP
jgi:hypothetical protein